MGTGFRDGLMLHHIGVTATTPPANHSSLVY